jgi:hypothetical protein
VTKRLSYGAALLAIILPIANSKDSFNSLLQLPTPELNSIICCNCQLQNSTLVSAATANSSTQLNSLLQLQTPELNSILCCICQLQNSTQF